MDIPLYNSTSMMQAQAATMPAGAYSTSSNPESITDNFNHVLGKIQKKTQTHEEKAYEAAGDLVANALILPILEQLRRGNLAKDTFFAPGNAENTFGPEFDIQIADRIAHSPNMACTQAIAEKLLSRGGKISRVKKTQETVGAAQNVNGIECYG